MATAEAARPGTQLSRGPSLRRHGGGSAAFLSTSSRSSAWLQPRLALGELRPAPCAYNADRGLRVVLRAAPASTITPVDVPARSTAFARLHNDPRIPLATEYSS